MQIVFAVRRLIIFYMYIYNVHSTFKNNTKFTLHTSFVHATVIKSLVWVHDFRGFVMNIDVFVLINRILPYGDTKNNYLYDQ